MKKTAVCSGCGYSGPMKSTASAYSWGKCPKCGTTNLEVKVICDCGTEMSTVYGNLKRCLKCDPATEEEKRTQGLR